MSRGTVFVTGGTGRVGQCLVRRLASLGFFVKVLTRRQCHPWRGFDNIKVIKGDILDEKAIKDEIAGCDYFFHLAVYQDINDGRKGLFWQVNVEGTKKVLNASIGSGVKKIVYVSTINVFEPTGETERDEGWAQRASFEGDYYIQTKIEALRFVRRMKEMLPLVIVYPTAAIDLNDFSSSLPARAAGLQRFLWEKIGGGIPGGLINRIGRQDRVFNYVVIEDLVEGIILAGTRGHAGQEYILGGENITVRDYLTAASKRLNKKPSGFRIPFWALKFIAAFRWFLFLPPIIGLIAKECPVDMYFSSKKAKEFLGYEPKLKL